MEDRPEKRRISKRLHKGHRMLRSDAHRFGEMPQCWRVEWEMSSIGRRRGFWMCSARSTSFAQRDCWNEKMRSATGTALRALRAARGRTSPLAEAPTARRARPTASVRRVPWPLSPVLWPTATLRRALSWHRSASATLDTMARRVMHALWRTTVLGARHLTRVLTTATLFWAQAWRRSVCVLTIQPPTHPASASVPLGISISRIRARRLVGDAICVRRTRTACTESRISVLLVLHRFLDQATTPRASARLPRI